MTNNLVIIKRRIIVFSNALTAFIIQIGSRILNILGRE